MNNKNDIKKLEYKVKSEDTPGGIVGKKHGQWLCVGQKRLRLKGDNGEWLDEWWHEDEWLYSGPGWSDKIYPEADEQ